ncbi:CHASE2 domain-containing protein [Nostoc sp. CHAB 5784]|uniref:CHASE2 domain-containing protein n=1 Tax=Nostoc mirabile TaxID=2907820 RepID=UPI001E2F3F0B|nr:CHASE2 domain-containing protein [Nostoc mirabile]MCC5664755.1 CHASE2 domain-containing protein [Nostoc mirabile CHAB5784]
MSKIQPEVANRRIESFKKRFGKAHLYLAYHAAFPLALTPDLLYRLWANFQRDIHGQMLSIPWVSVADLLLSSLCDEVGHELYEMDLAIRKELLKCLKEDPDFGIQRLDELANFVLDYIHPQFRNDDPDIQDFAQAQRWTALGYVLPSEATRELALTLSKLDQNRDKAEILRLASLVETVGESVAEFEPLLIYTRGMRSFIRGDLESAITQFKRVTIYQNQIQVAGIDLLVPEEIIKVIEHSINDASRSEKQQIFSSTLKVFSRQVASRQDLINNSETSSSRHPFNTATNTAWLQTLLVTSVVVTALVWGVRELKWLQPWELSVYDQMLRSRPAEAPDRRILLVKITDEDLKREKWTLSDRRVNQLLKKIESYQPRIVGLYLFQPENNYLAANLQNQDNIVSTCLFNTLGKDEIPPPPNFPIDNVGFSNVVADNENDQILRRSLLFVYSPEKKCTTSFAFGALIAINYLEKQGIEYDFTNKGDFQLGKTLFPRLQPNSGSYEHLNADGYQILLNYRHPNSIADPVTLTQVLSGQVNPNLVKDRLVIIGTTAANFPQGSFYTPYSALPDQPARMSALFIHAQIASQLISTVLDGRPLIWYWPDWAELIWVWGWSLLGSVLAWRIHHPLFLALASGIAIIVLSSFCIALFFQAAWIPLIPPALALVFASTSVMVYVRFQPRIASKITEESHQNNLPNNLTKKN